MWLWRDTIVCLRFLHHHCQIIGAQVQLLWGTWLVLPPSRDASVSLCCVCLSVLSLSGGEKRKEGGGNGGERRSVLLRPAWAKLYQGVNQKPARGHHDRAGQGGLH